MRERLAIWGAILVVIVLVAFGLWKAIGSLFTVDPVKSELRLPTITDEAAKSLPRGRQDGATRREVFDEFGRGMFDVTTNPRLRTGFSQDCYIWRVAGSEANSAGHFPLWELCFDDRTHRLVNDGTGRFHDEP